MEYWAAEAQVRAVFGSGEEGEAAMRDAFAKLLMSGVLSLVDLDAAAKADSHPG